MSGVVYREGGPLSLDLRAERRVAPPPAAVVEDMRLNLMLERFAVLAECERLTGLVEEGLARAWELDVILSLGASE